MAQTIADSDTLDVVNWNVEWFGNRAFHDPSVQADGIRHIMDSVDADVYAFCEVVDVDTFSRMVHALKGSYDYIVSPFGSFAPDTNSANYAGAQKLALVYRKGLLRNISYRPMLASSVTAYVNFSSGRFPFELTAEVLGKDSIWRQTSFIILHAKAFTDPNSCARRIDGCRELKDSLDRYYPNKPFLILGDFNDDLDVSNCPSFAESNYWYMIRDSIHYVPLTLDISRAGAYSSDGYSSLIDHVIASDEMAHYYVPKSAEVLRSLVKRIDSKYNQNISDHFPVRTRYVLDEHTTSVTNSPEHARSLHVYPNPASGRLTVKAGDIDWSRFYIYDMLGSLVACPSTISSRIIDVSRLRDGLYLLLAETSRGERAGTVFRVVQ